MRKVRVLGMSWPVLAMLAVAGCTATATQTPTTNASTGSETPTPVVAVALEVSLDGIQVVNGDGSRGESALLADGAATLALLSKELGTAQTHEKGSGSDDTAGSYGWDSLSLRVDTGGSAAAVITGARAGGLSLRTTEGIAVGSTEAAVKAVASPGTQFDSNGDSYFGLQARTHPGTQSLTFPGRVGLDYIDVAVTGGVVSSIFSPGGDWQDL